MVSCTALKLLQVVKALSITGLILIGSCRQIYSMESELAKEKDPMGFIDDLDCVQVSTVHGSHLLEIVDGSVVPKNKTLTSLQFQVAAACAWHASKEKYENAKSLFDGAQKLNLLSANTPWNEVVYAEQKKSNPFSITFGALSMQTTVAFQGNEDRAVNVSYQISRVKLKEGAALLHNYRT
jgi:hypothetical protein